MVEQKNEIVQNASAPRRDAAVAVAGVARAELGRLYFSTPLGLKHLVDETAYSFAERGEIHY